MEIRRAYQFEARIGGLVLAPAGRILELPPGWRDTLLLGHQVAQKFYTSPSRPLTPLTSPLCTFPMHAVGNGRRYCPRLPNWWWFVEKKKGLHFPQRLAGAGGETEKNGAVGWVNLRSAEEKRRGRQAMIPRNCAKVKKEKYLDCGEEYPCYHQ